MTTIGHLRSIFYPRPDDPKAAKLMVQRLAKVAACGAPVRAVVLDRLGPDIWRRSLAQAQFDAQCRPFDATW